MTIWKRLRNLWALSNVDLSAPAKVEVIREFKTQTQAEAQIILPSNFTPQQAKATIIKRNKRNPVKEIVGDETAI